MCQKGLIISIFELYENTSQTKDSFWTDFIFNIHTYIKACPLEVTNIQIHTHDIHERS